MPDEPNTNNWGWFRCIYADAKEWSGFKNTIGKIERECRGMRDGWSLFVILALLLMGGTFYVTRLYFSETTKHSSDSIDRIPTPTPIPIVSPSPTPTKHAATLYQLFDTDLTLGRTANMPGHIEVSYANGAKHADVEFRLIVDYATNAEFLKFYVPETMDTFEVCSAIPDSINAARDSVEKYMRGSVLSSFSEDGEQKFNDIKFTGSVYVYAPMMLSLEERADIKKVFDRNNLTLHLRGMNYWSAQMKDSQ
jgi:hypothetical protein